MKTIDECISCARRELAMRHTVYPNRIQNRKMSMEKADHEIACMQRIVEILEAVKLARPDAVHNIQGPVGP